MQIFSNSDGTSFLYNGIKYVKNFIVIPLGTTNVGVYNAYDTRLQLLASTRYSEISVNGATFGNQAQLINALAPILFAKASNGGGSIVTQNNIGLALSYPSLFGFTIGTTITTAELATKINEQVSFGISEIQTPVTIQVQRYYPVGGNNMRARSKKYLFLFNGGKGSWGMNNTPTASSNFTLLYESVITQSDIEDDDNSQINGLGEILDGDYISVANQSEWNFFDETKDFYFSYTTDGVLYFVLFVGEPGIYGLGNVLFTDDMFIDTTNSDNGTVIVPTLQQVIETGASATTTTDIIFTTIGDKKLKYNNSEVLTDANSQAKFNAKADLVNGVIPASQLPAYVDDVLEFATMAEFPAIGESGKIYITVNTNLTYRWSGTGYAEISPSIALGETSSTAYRGDRGKVAYDHSQTSGNPHGTSKADIGLGNADNTSDANKPISTATQTALNAKANDTQVLHKFGDEKSTGLKSFRQIGFDFTDGNTISKVGLDGNGRYLHFLIPNGDASFSIDTYGTKNSIFWGELTVPAGTISTSAVNKGQLDLKANNADVLHTINNEVKYGNLSFADAGIGFIKALGGVAWSAKLDPSNNLIFGNDYQTVTPSLRLNETGNVDISNGKLSVLGQPISDYDVPRMIELNLKANDADVLHKAGAETITGVKTFDISPIVPDGTTGYDAVNVQQLQKKVTLTGNENIGGIKTFDSSPNIPNGLTAYQAVNVLQLQEKANDTNVIHKSGDESRTGLLINKGIFAAVNEDRNLGLAIDPNTYSDTVNIQGVTANLSTVKNITLNGNGGFVNIGGGVPFFPLDVNGVIRSNNAIVAGTGHGFQNESFNGGYNPIWNFRVSPSFGLGYYQLNGADRIGHHFGDTANPVFWSREDGISYMKKGLVLGTYNEVPAERKTIEFNAGGYSIPSTFQTDSSGDKIVLYNGSDYDGRIGVGASGNMWFKSYSTVGGGGYDFYTSSSNLNPQLAMKVSGNGNVGIGTSMPLLPLDVNGGVRINSSLTLGFYSNPWIIESNPGGGQADGIRFVKQGIDMYFNGDNSGKFHFYRPLEVPNGLVTTDAVNKGQLDSAVLNVMSDTANNYINRTGDESKTGVLSFLNAPNVPYANNDDNPVPLGQLRNILPFTELLKFEERQTEIVYIDPNNYYQKTIDAPGVTTDDFLEFYGGYEALINRDVTLIAWIPDNDKITYKVENFQSLTSQVPARIMFRVIK